MSATSESACYVLFRKDGRLLFVLRENTGFMDGKYSLPAGRVEKGEPYSDGAVREALEEVGLTTLASNLHHVCTVHRKSGDDRVWTDVYFEADDWQGEPFNAEPDKHSTIAWLPLDELPDTVMDYQHYALTQIVAGKTYGEFGWI